MDPKVAYQQAVLGQLGITSWRLTDPGLLADASENTIIPTAPGTGSVQQLETTAETIATVETASNAESTEVEAEQQPTITIEQPVVVETELHQAVLIDTQLPQILVSDIKTACTGLGLKVWSSDNLDEQDRFVLALAVNPSLLTRSDTCIDLDAVPLNPDIKRDIWQSLLACADNE